MNNVLIIGCGIIGGSIIKKLSSNPEYKLSFYDSNPVTIKEIRNTYNCEYSEVLTGFEHIILAVPISKIFHYFDILSELESEAIVYDCSSTKSEIENYALKKSINYIGMHPMCGSEKSGFANSNHDLFKNKKIICTKSTPFTKNIIFDLGAEQIVMSSRVHDRLVAQISHVPQLMSLIINQVDAEAREIAGNGFKDMTRISSSPYKMWDEILSTNKENIIESLEVVRVNLNTMIYQLENNEYQELEKWFEDK